MCDICPECRCLWELEECWVPWSHVQLGTAQCGLELKVSVSPPGPVSSSTPTPHPQFSETNLSSIF